MQQGFFSFSSLPSAKPDPESIGRQESCMMDLTVPTCWKYWLKLKDEYCPYIMNGFSHLAPRVIFLPVLGHAGNSIVLKVQIEDRIYALKLGQSATDGLFTISESQEAELNEMPQGDWRRWEVTFLEPIHGLLLDHIDGCDLNKATPPLDAPILRDILAKLHSLDIIHADFEYSNIMVSKDGEGHIIDFSAAKPWPNIRQSREGFDEWQKVEVHYLEYFFLMLQNVGL
ncbi:hypothetical protein FQN55_000728 [Onygenales sp. PD_40]|nr:hypothetical protein FQN55_000728 [Onygenales sp. PD_40]